MRLIPNIITIYPFNVQSWVRVATTGETGVPSARRDHATILLGTTQHSAHLFMTGGIDKKWHSLGDAWILNLKREGDKISQGSWLKVSYSCYFTLPSMNCMVWYTWQSIVMPE